MHHDDIGQRVTDLVFLHSPEPPETRSTRLRLVDDLGYTSLGLMELATAIALEFELEPIDEERLFDVETVDNVIVLVESIAG